jgi:hypothetical protein
MRPAVVSLAEICEEGIEIRPSEAVAIVQQLIHEPGSGESLGPQAAPGPPSTARVYLYLNGSVACAASDATPAVSELAALLDALVPPGHPEMPGGLRYTIARALLDVDAPPFDSLDEFSRALARFERGDRREVVRSLLERSAAARRSVGLSRLRLPPLDPRVGEGGRQLVAFPSPSDRRAPTVSVTELRRQLREADQLLFAQRTARAAIGPRPRPTFGRRVPAIAAGLVAGLSLIGVGEAMHLRRTAQAPPPQAPPALSRSTSLAAPAPVSAAPALHATPAMETPAVVEPVHPRARRPSTTRAIHRAAKVARAETPVPSSSPSASTRRREHRRQKEATGLFGRVRFKWVDDISTGRQ